MAPEIAQDRPPKIARKEPVQDGVIEGITRKEDEIKGVREEIRRKDDEIKVVTEKIKVVTEEIKGLREEIRRTDEKIDEVIGPEQRKALEARLDFLRQQIQNYWLLISSLGEDKNRLREDINRLREEVLEESAVDKSRQWSEVMLLEELPALPKNANELRSILFPTQTGKLPVIAQVKIRS